MAWVNLYHNKCKLPTYKEIEKDHAETGSVFKCTTTGCGKVWRLQVHITKFRDSAVMDQKTYSWRQLTRIEDYVFDEESEAVEADNG